MRAPRRRRPRLRAVLPESERPDPSVADEATFLGSPEHKDTPSFAGMPRPRSDASICSPELSGQQIKLTRWLRQAIRRGAVGAPVEGRFPRYVWFKEGGVVYEGRLVNRGTGEYKGYQLVRDEWPQGLEELYD